MSTLPKRRPESSTVFNTMKSGAFRIVNNVITRRDVKFKTMTLSIANGILSVKNNREKLRVKCCGETKVAKEISRK